MRIFIQYTFSIIITVLFVSVLLFAYFKYIIGFSTIRTELITFNSIYLLALIFYHLFFFSQFFLNRKNTDKIEKEEADKETLYLELQNFKNQVNPELLFQSLEIIISELHRDKKSADGLVDELSKVYRYSLDNKNNDLISLKDELNSLSPVLSIYNAKFKNHITIEKKVNKDTLNFNLIPGTLQMVLEYALSENLITDSLPLKLKIETKDANLYISYRLNKKITENNPVKSRLNFLKKAYSYYKSAEDLNADFISKTEENRIFKIPLLEIIED